jgi:homoserine dehydrogenase
MVRPVSTATGREAHVIIGLELDRKRCQNPDEDQRNGEQPPHLEWMIHHVRNLLNQTVDAIGQLSSVYSFRGNASRWKFDANRETPSQSAKERLPVSELNVSTSPREGSFQTSQGPRKQLPLKIAIFGFGTVGSSVARILVASQPQELRLTHVFNRDVERKRAHWTATDVIWSADADAVIDSDVDVIVELAGGLDPAGDWVRRALANGKSVVTANKKLIAFHGAELEQLAAANGCHLKYGAAVAGGIPVIPALEQGLAGDRIERIEGILNGTCNFILSKMEDGAEYSAVLAEAQAAGYAESDPTEDVGGFDARAKLAILMRLALRVEVHPEEIVPNSITRLSAVDFSYARELGCTIRQVARGEQSQGQVAAAVGPSLVALRSPLAWSRGTENMVILSGHYGGDVVFSGHGAGGHPTAVAVVSDLLALAHGSRRVEIPFAPAKLSAEFEVPHYIRFLVKDRSGIVAEITGALAREKINIRAIVQKPGFPSNALPFVVTVEPCKSSAMKRALESMRTMECMIEEPLDLQILE